MRMLLGTLTIAVALSTSPGWAAKAPERAAPAAASTTAGMTLLQAMTGKTVVAQEDRIQLAQRRRRGGVRRGRRGAGRGLRRGPRIGRRGGNRRRWRRRRNRNLAVGIGAALVTGLIATEVARERRRDCRRWARQCDRGSWRACERYDDNC